MLVCETNFARPKNIALLACGQFGKNESENYGFFIIDIIAASFFFIQTLSH